MDHRKYHPWLICFTVSLFFLYVFLQMNALNAISVDLIKAYNLSNTGLGILSASYLLALALFFLPVGILLDHFSIRYMILIGMGLEILAVFLFAMAPNLLIAILARFVCGGIHALAFLACLRLASRWLPQRLGLAIGMIVTIGMVGGLLAQLPFTLLLHILQWRWVFIVLGIIGIGFWGLFAFIIYDNPSMPMADRPSHSVLSELGQVITSSQNWLCALYASLLNLPLILLGALWGTLYLTHETGLNTTQAAWVLSMIYLGLMIGSPVVGWISDRIPSRKKPMILGALFSLILICLIFFACHLSFYMLLILFLSLSVMTSAQVLSYPTISESNLPSVESTSLGFASIIIMGGGAVAQPLFGWLVEHGVPSFQRIFGFNSYHAAFFIIPLGLLCSLIISTFIEETKAS